jgi:hypothetical protein
LCGTGGCEWNWARLPPIRTSKVIGQGVPAPNHVAPFSSKLINKEDTLIEFHSISKDTSPNTRYNIEERKSLKNLNLYLNEYTELSKTLIIG